MSNRYYGPLHCGGYYHVFSRAVGDEKVFRDEENYQYFLDRLRHHISPVAAVLAYSLMPNHFHLLIRVREEKEVQAYFLLVKKISYNPQQHDLSDFVVERFGNCLNGYVQAFNKRYRRKGGLFMNRIRRNRAEETADILTFLFYIHKNAVHHGLEQQIGLWPYDSYRPLISGDQAWLEREEVMALLDGKQGFIQFHRKLSVANDYPTPNEF